MDCEGLAVFLCFASEHHLDDCLIAHLISTISSLSCVLPSITGGCSQLVFLSPPPDSTSLHVRNRMCLSKSDMRGGILGVGSNGLGMASKFPTFDGDLSCYQS
ncbi:hypothetical protein Hdeb2414_s0023g00641301 [Helianthus debilis subsp. tardiflorus]